MGYTVLNVKDYGALGDGSHNDTANIQAALDAAFGSSSSPHGQSSQLNRAVFFPAGIYIVSGNPAIRVTGVKGGLIFGEGMQSSIIRGTTNGGVTFLLNGFGFSTMRDLTVDCTGTGAVVALDYDWDNVAPMGSQNSSFINCFFAGNPGSQNVSAIACRMGNSGFQTDTSTFLNCSFFNANYGLTPSNLNCIGMTVIGGQFLQNNYGIFVAAGGVETIHGSFFASNLTYDIGVSGGALNGYSIAGCRSESQNFLSVGGPCVFHIQSCDHAAVLLGKFVNVNAPTHIDSCWSSLGEVFMGGGGSSIGNVIITNSVFDRFDAIDVTAGGSSIVTTTSLKDVYVGDIRTGLSRYIIDQKIVRNIVRTIGVEATALTDPQVLYDSYNGIITQNNVANSLPSATNSPTFTVASPTVVNFGQNHNFQGGEPVAFSLVTTGSLPTGITSGLTYFVTKDSLTNNIAGGQQTCHLSDTQAHALAGTNTINVSGSGSGNINAWAVRRWAVGDILLKSDVAAGGSPGWACTTAGWGSTVSAGETQAVFKALPNVAA